MKKINVIKQNMHLICNCFIKCIGVTASILSVIFLFITWEDFGITKLLFKLEIIAIICAILLLWSILWSCVLKKQKVIWQSASGRIIVQYSDLLEEGFKKKNNRDCLYVIPVNSAFDTIVDTDISLCSKPLISPNSLHGKWIKKVIENGGSIEDIDNEITSYLEKQEIKPCKILSKENKERGKRKIYELGTVSIIKGVTGNTFLLLAATNFDENNNAYVSVEEVEYVIKALIRFYNQHGQGHELMIPLMGTNLSRAGLSHDDSLRILTSMFQLYGDLIHGDVRIVIYKGDKDKVTLGV